MNFQTDSRSQRQIFLKQRNAPHKAPVDFMTLPLFKEKLTDYIHYPASRTLQIAQSLYERHKVITYPRTDSKALPEDYGPTVQNLLESIQVNWLLMLKKHFNPTG